MVRLLRAVQTRRAPQSIWSQFHNNAFAVRPVGGVELMLEASTMTQISIPDSLFQQIEQARTPAVSADEFVQEAVREKLASERKREEFRQLTAGIRQAMLEKGLTEDEILADFDVQRKGIGE
jgi:hypothetical protein